jgi:hypothetical protein
MDTDALSHRIRSVAPVRERVLLSAANNLDAPSSLREMHRYVTRQLRSSPSFRVEELFQQQDPWTRLKRQEDFSSADKNLAWKYVVIAFSATAPSSLVNLSAVVAGV